VSAPDARNGGVGSVVSVYTAGGLGDPSRLLGRRELVATSGYTAGVQAIAHLGCGALTTVDVAIDLADGRRVEMRSTATNQRLEVT
jgi:hypothetical protein